MTAVDFEQWVAPDLVLTLGGRTYRVPPPSVEDAGRILALAVVAEVMLGISAGPVPDPVQEVVDGIGRHEHPALGPVYRQMVDDGLLPVTVDRAATYAIFFWARGREYADAIAVLIWTPRDAVEAGGATPKA